MPYDWSPEKAVSNLVKHKVSFTAMEQFAWDTALVLSDVRGYSEPRLGALGAIGGRLHFVVFTVERRTVWIVSLRKANRKEVSFYASEG